MRKKQSTTKRNQYGQKTGSAKASSGKPATRRKTYTSKATNNPFAKGTKEHREKYLDDQATERVRRGMGGRTTKSAAYKKRKK